MITSPPSRVDAARGGVERLRAHAEPQVELERVERLGLVEPDLVGLAVAAQQLLRERRPVVGPLALGAREHEPARKPAAAQRLRAADPGERAADDGDGVEGQEEISRGRSCLIAFLEGHGGDSGRC